MDQLNDLEQRRSQALDKICDLVLAAGETSQLTDKYFSHSKRIAERHGEQEVVYAIFMRRRMIAALEPMIRLLKRMVPEANVKRYFADGEIIPSETKIIEVTGPYSSLSEIETLILQKVGFPCVVANNAYEMCRALPKCSFLDMHARHAMGPEMNLLAAYGASVGSLAARKDFGAKGFIGSSQDLTAPLYGAEKGAGTMPHALIGYTEGDVLKATKLFAEFVPDVKTLVALVDYSGLEVSDSLKCADWFFNSAKLHDQGKEFAVRIDTHGGRFCEGLDYEKSVDVVGEWLGVQGEYNIVEQVLGERATQLDSGNILVDQVRRILFGKGVSVANAIHIRRSLDKAGFNKVSIVASSGFDTQKCQVVAAANTPIDVVGTGSFLPKTLSETYATADIISYNGVKRVKVGREHLFD